MDTEGPAKESAVGKLVIYPKFDRPELLQSVSAVLDAAQSCLATGETWKKPRSVRSDISYFSADRVDGTDVEPWTRSIELKCNARPVTRCTYALTWDEAGSNLGYASVECVGSNDGPEVRYSVTAAIDASGAKGEPGKKGAKGLSAYTVTFFTNEFPGTMSWLHARAKRSDGSVVQIPTITQFDDFSDMDEAQTGIFSMGEMLRSVRSVHGLACSALGADDVCDRAMPLTVASSH